MIGKGTIILICDVFLRLFYLEEFLGLRDFVLQSSSRTAEGSADQDRSFLEAQENQRTSNM